MNISLLECDCDYCDPDTGLCECPPNTAGADCACIRGTFGYDPVQGCLPCDCESTGVTGASSSCNATTGQCLCLASRSGRRCDQCKPGYYGYPNCRKCDCNEAGITGCDPDTGRCICKVSHSVAVNSYILDQVLWHPKFLGQMVIILPVQRHYLQTYNVKPTNIWMSQTSNSATVLLYIASTPMNSDLIKFKYETTLLRWSHH